MASNKPVLICAQLTAIQVVGTDLTMTENSDTRSEYFVRVFVDKKEIAKSEKKPSLPSPRWEWQEDNQFWFSSLSTIKIVIYCKSRNKFTKHLIGQHTGNAFELVENDTTIDLKDKTGAVIASKIKINLSLVSEPSDKTFMKKVDAYISGLDDAVGRCYSMLNLP